MACPRKPQGPADAREMELERALKRLAAGADPRQVMEDMSRRLMNKLMHEPLSLVRDQVGRAG